jgi:dTDP-4-dehydrorhamnose 3,5-epimerase
MSRIRLLPTPINGVSVAQSHVNTDHRGSFSRLFCARELSEVIGERQILQSNQSVTVIVGAIRGMHFQRPPHAELKMVRCLRGRVWDVAVDLRAGSSTFLQWHAEELSPDNARALVIPEGCAHGFQVLEPGSELLYFHTAYYVPEAEGGVRYDDPLLSIKWPRPVSDVSVRDQRHPYLSSEFRGISI